jgi:hypothetical protein
LASGTYRIWNQHSFGEKPYFHCICIGLSFSIWPLWPWPMTWVTETYIFFEALQYSSLLQSNRFPDTFLSL